MRASGLKLLHREICVSNPEILRTQSSVRFESMLPVQDHQLFSHIGYQHISPFVSIVLFPALFSLLSCCCSVLCPLLLLLSLLSSVLSLLSCLPFALPSLLSTPHSLLLHTPLTCVCVCSNVFVRACVWGVLVTTVSLCYLVLVAFTSVGGEWLHTLAFIVNSQEKHEDSSTQSSKSSDAEVLWFFTTFAAVDKQSKG